MSREPRAADVVILGAGAAGLMCAFEAGRRGRCVLLLDHGDRPGRKILISGGGRCNFTNTGTQAENFLGENPHFARSALARFTPGDMVALVEKHGIRYHEKALGQLFCDDSAKRIVTLLERECAEAGVDLRPGVRILRASQTDTAGSHGPASARFLIETSAGSISCRTLVVATGGLSIPKMGATGFGYDLARQCGHRVVEPRPALVPLTFAPDALSQWSDLAGLSMEVIAEVRESAGEAAQKTNAASKAVGSKAVGSKAVGSKAVGTGPRRQVPPAFREKLLITHRGVSGPAALQISSYWRTGAPLRFDLAPDQTVFMELKSPAARRDRGALLSALRGVLPARFAERWTDLQLDRGTDWTNAGLSRLEAALHHWQVEPAGTEGYAKAEVTAGGVDTRELDARTLESLRVPGLHFIGEVVDVTGWLGGYNFQWAWASAAACGRSL